MNGIGVTLVLVALVAIVAWLIKSLSGGDSSSETASGASTARVLGDRETIDPDPDDELAEGEEAEAALLDAGEAVAMDSDGMSFVPMGHGIGLVPPKAPLDVPGHPVERGGLRGLLSGGDEEFATAQAARFGRLDPGDLLGARVVRGAPDHDPWRLEGLGRDRDYRAWRFETEEAARAAHALVEARIVRAPRDEDGDPTPMTADDYATALREHEEIERELAAMGDEPDDAEPPR